MDETISVFFTPIQGAPGQYHGTLVYTDSSGQRFYAGATRSTWSTQATASDALLAEASVNTGIGSNPLGTLISLTGKYTPSLNDSGPTKNWFDPGNPSYTLFSGQNLSSKWSTITGTITQIGNLGLPYAPLDQNSNSAWCTAAFDAGASWQTIYNARVAAGVNAPGCGVFISTPSRQTILIPISSLPPGDGGDSTTLAILPAATTAEAYLLDQALYGTTENGIVDWSDSIIDQIKQLRNNFSFPVGPSKSNAAADSIATPDNLVTHTDSNGPSAPATPPQPPKNIQATQRLVVEATALERRIGEQARRAAAIIMGDVPQAQQVAALWGGPDMARLDSILPHLMPPLPGSLFGAASAALKVAIPPPKAEPARPRIVAMVGNRIVGVIEGSDEEASDKHDPGNDEDHRGTNSHYYPTVA
jgi:hypothetical protein